MAETIQVYLLYEPDLDQEARIDLLRQVYACPDVDPGKELDDVLEEKERTDLFHVDIKYDSVMVTLDLEPDRPENLPDAPCIAIDVHELYYRPSKVGEERVEAAISDFIDLVVRVYEQSCSIGNAPSYVIGADPNQVDALRGRFGWTVELTKAGVIRGTVQQLFWLQVLPPATVDEIGREKILSAPAVKVEELSDGAVLLVAYDRPYPPGDSDVDELADYLDAEANNYYR